MNFDINDLDFRNIGNLPVPAKLAVLFLFAVLIIGVGYGLLWQSEIKAYDEAVTKEAELRQVFLTKKNQAVKIETYRLQMAEIERTFGALLKQLPDRSEMDGLLTDINQAGLGRGLEFELFKPGREAVFDFYAEMPIRIKVKGNYHDIGAFATAVSQLSRIVTLNNLAITPVQKSDVLMLNATAKTYRYLDSSELASRKKKKGAK